MPVRDFKILNYFGLVWLGMLKSEITAVNGSGTRYLECNVDINIGMAFMQTINGLVILLAFVSVVRSTVFELECKNKID